MGLVTWAQRLLTENLRDDDFSVLSAATGAEAIEMLGQSRPDVVLLDVVLRDVSGYDVCRLVRAGDRVNDPCDPDLPMIFLSAKANPSTASGDSCVGRRLCHQAVPPSQPEPSEPASWRAPGTIRTCVLRLRSRPGAGGTR
jgi:CheY-like chemotaxis protein